MAESDMFSSIDEELISDIKRPSLISLTSEDSRGSEEERNVPSDYGPINYNIAASTPLKDDTNEDYHFKIPLNFPSCRDGKRFSLTSCNDNTCAYNMNKSNSMHDVSSIASFSSLRRDSSCMYSTETLQSNSIATTKSKDSGFQRSTSCSSLTTNSSKKYDHVQSKVKLYIQTIKQSEALRKMQKRLQDNAFTQSRESIENLNFDSPETSPASDTIPVSKIELLNKVKELEEEIKEKDCVIEQLEKNHSELRLKYAAAETHIDDLRIRVSQNEDPISYISDEKVAELLTSNAKNPRRYAVSPITKPVIKTEADVVPYEMAFARPVRELQPIKKFCSNSVKLNETYPLLKSSNLLKSSSCKHVKECNYELSKSASNIDKACVGFAEDDVLSYSRAKVQQWQRSLVNLSRADESQMEVCYSGDAYESRRCCVHDDQRPDDVSKKSRRYLKNKDADKKNYRKSYPVGCKCEKYKKIKDDTKPAPRRKLTRSVSFANYEESMTSSMYDDESSSDSSAVVVPKHESYKTFKQRKLQEKYERSGRRSPRWSEIKKAKSASNIHKDPPNRNKRLIDNVSTSQEHSCSERNKHCVKSHKSKYRKLDDCSKVASAACNVLKCRSAHSCQNSHQHYIVHSKSYDACSRSHERDRDRCLVRMKKFPRKARHKRIKNIVMICQVINRIRMLYSSLFVDLPSQCGFVYIIRVITNYGNCIRTRVPYTSVVSGLKPFVVLATRTP